VQVFAPVSGRVLIVVKESETIVTPGMPIMKIAVLGAAANTEKPASPHNSPV